jgi:hypothetical protein
MGRGMGEEGAAEEDGHWGEEQQNQRRATFPVAVQPKCCFGGGSTGWSDAVEPCRQRAKC